MPDRHAGLSRAFDLSRASYFLDFALVPIAVGALAWFALWRDLGALGLALSVGIGVLAWSLAEYWIHRAIFHGSNGFERMHQIHHALPRDMVGVASWGTFAAFAVLWLVAEVFAGPAIGSAMTAGFMLGYLSYCMIHVRMHHGNRARFTRYLAFMFEHHAGHHRGGSGNFGVSSPIWDFVFNTYRKA